MSTSNVTQSPVDKAVETTKRLINQKVSSPQLRSELETKLEQARDAFFASRASNAQNSFFIKIREITDQIAAQLPK